jgi:hypothetical protein
MRCDAIMPEKAVYPNAEVMNQNSARLMRNQFLMEDQLSMAAQCTMNNNCP